DLFPLLMLVALLKQPLSLDSKALYLGEKVPLFHIIDKLNLYAEHESDETALIRVAGCLLRHMKVESSEQLARVLPAAALAQAPQGLLGAGEPLEWLVRVRIVLFIELSCAHVGTWEAVV